MDLHRIVCYVLDFERYGVDDYKSVIENAADWTSVGECQTADIGEYDDDHPINTGKVDSESYFPDNRDTRIAALEAEVARLNSIIASYVMDKEPFE